MTRHHYRTLATGLLALAFGGAVAQVASPSGQAFERAMQDYEVQHFDRAFEVLARLADARHPEAARIALLMSAVGPRLYGRAFELDRSRRERWLDSAAHADRPLSASR